MACVYALHLDSAPEDVRYIGMTKYPTAEERLRGHLRASVKSSTKGIPVYDWIRKHGVDRIRVTTLYSSISLSQAMQLERSLIVQYRKKIGKSLLNCNDGGEGAFNPTQETRDKMSRSRKGKAPHPNASSPEAREKISKALKGRVFSDEWKRKLSEARKNIKISEETRKKMSESHKGVVHTDESKAKMSAIRKARAPFSEDKKQEISRKISESRKGKPSWNKGKKMSLEARRNMSKSALKRANKD